MSALAFLPRSIGKSKRDPHRNHEHSSRIETAPALSETSSASKRAFTADKPARSAAPLDDEEILALLELSLSDHALWCTPDLRHLMKSGRDGYLPMSYLLKNSPVFHAADSPISEVRLTQCLKASAESFLEARMLIVEPSYNDWHGRAQARKPGSKGADAGGFEVRRKDWEDVLQNLDSGKWNKEWWDRRTVYIERLPIAVRSVSAISRYIKSLLLQDDQATSSSASENMVQSVMFPPHHSASTNDPQSCKGFAFVVLCSPELATKLCNDYSWEGISSSKVVGLDRDALDHGLRVMSKASWEILKAEYISYQQHLLSEAAKEAEILEPSFTAKNPYENGEALPLRFDSGQTTVRYPKNCVVFVRNVHPGTNKTTLRSLFQKFLDVKGGSVDYVDFYKGVDSCHLRLSSPSEAAQLISHFECNLVAQIDPLDQVGSAAATQDRPRLELELVQGKREDLYWEKVPENLRNAALKRQKGEDEDGQHSGTTAVGGQRRKRSRIS